ncbi:MAG: trypsin-like peptidase domain-containing protein [Planctomycetota bacterium]|jgi:serine protease Do
MPDRTVRLLLLCGGVLCITLASLASGQLPPTPGAASQLRRTPIVRAVQRARPSIVNIHGEKVIPRNDSLPTRTDDGQRVNGMGTGVVIDSRGYILTNHHVVDGVRQIQVTSADGRQLTASLLVHDPETDLAIIKIDSREELPAITVGTSSDLMPGEPVVAVGNAFGYEHTVTRGIISALHRPVQINDAQFYDDLIQTDASINPGNSGGPLLNIDGEMIGINVAVRAGAQGIGFALPVDKALAVAARLLASRNVKNAWHGVVPADDSGSFEGVTVASVEKESPAAEGGLRSGDLITAVEDTPLKRSLDFARAMLQRKAGEKVQLSVRRAGQPVEVPLTLARMPARAKPRADLAWEVLGLELEPIPGRQFRARHRTSYRGGLSVTAVRSGSAAAKQGIRAGDVLVGMHIWETVSVENVSYVLKRPDFSKLTPLRFFILRGNQTLYGYLPISIATARRP